MILRDNLYFLIPRAGQDPAPTQAAYGNGVLPSDAGEDPLPSYSIRLNPECFIYKAHFPGQPVTPGVCLVQIATELLGEAVGRSLKIRRMKEAKFLAVVSPDTCPELTVRVLKIEEKEGEVSAKLSIEGEGEGEVKAKVSLSCV